MFNIHYNNNNEIIETKNKHFLRMFQLMAFCFLISIIFLLLCYKNYNFNCEILLNKSFTCQVNERQIFYINKSSTISNIKYIKSERPQLSKLNTSEVNAYLVDGQKVNIIQYTNIGETIEGKFIIKKEQALETKNKNFQIIIVEFLNIVNFFIFTSLLSFILAIRFIYKYKRSYNFSTNSNFFEFYSLLEDKNIKIHINSIDKIELFTKDGSAINSSSIKRYKKIKTGMLHLFDYYFIGVRIDFLFIDKAGQNYTFTLYAPDVNECYEFYIYLTNKINHLRMMTSTTININRLLEEEKNKQKK